MDLAHAAAALTLEIEESLDQWIDAQPDSPVLTGIYANANTVLDSERRIITERTLDTLYSRYSAINSAENPNPRTPASDRAEQLIQYLVHLYVEDLNLALTRAGYPGDRVTADTLKQLTNLDA